MGQQIDALDQVLAGLPNQQVVSAMAQRLEWLKGDFAVAPVAISQPTLRQEDKSVVLVPNFKTVLTGPGFEWTSIPYLLGVLLSELLRLEVLPLKTVQRLIKSAAVEEALDVVGVPRLKGSAAGGIPFGLGDVLQDIQDDDPVRTSAASVRFGGNELHRCYVLVLGEVVDRWIENAQDLCNNPVALTEPDGFFQRGVWLTAIGDRTFRGLKPHAFCIPDHVHERESARQSDAAL